MKIIAIEGLDKAGKHTQSNLLFRALLYTGSVGASEFHRYDTPTGKLIRDWLFGEYSVDQATIELIMAADKQAQQESIAQLESSGTQYLILDRYTTSQLVYGVASGESLSWLKSLQQNMRQPDIEILLDISVEESMRRKGKLDQLDRYERDFAFLSRVKQEYLTYFSSNDTPSKKFILSNIDNLSPKDLRAIVMETLSFLFS